jgi:hypothetical protein
MYGSRMTIPHGGDTPRHSCYPSRMTMPESGNDMRDMLLSIGIEVTDEGIRRAREQRLRAAAKHTPEMRAAWRRILAGQSPSHD